METVILVLLVISIMFNVILMFMTIKNKKDEISIVEKLGRFEFNITKDINNFKNDFDKELNGNFDKMNEKIERKLNLINDKVNERLDQNFEKTNKTFSNILERLSKIDEAQKKIETLSGDIVSLQSVLTDKKKSQEMREKYEKMFKADMKKHIDAISSKYIIPDETSDQAIMFLPAEAIFAEVNAYHQDIIDYAYKKHVWVTSPTTLISTLTVVQMIIKNMERDKYTSIIHNELNKLGQEFSRYKERWDHLAKSIQTVNKDVENVHITTEKISKRFNEISGVEIEKFELEDRS